MRKFFSIADEWYCDNQTMNAAFQQNKDKSSETRSYFPLRNLANSVVLTIIIPKIEECSSHSRPKVKCLYIPAKVEIAVLEEQWRWNKNECRRSRFIGWNIYTSSYISLGFSNLVQLIHDHCMVTSSRPFIPLHGHCDQINWHFSLPKFGILYSKK